jgi:hypothetical protein
VSLVGLIHSSGTTSQQSNHLPSMVGQQAPLSPRALHCGFCVQDSSISPPQHVKVQSSMVGQHCPVRPWAAQASFWAHSDDTASAAGRGSGVGGSVGPALAETGMKMSTLVALSCSSSLSSVNAIIVPVGGSDDDGPIVSSVASVVIWVGLNVNGTTAVVDGAMVGSVCACATSINMYTNTAFAIAVVMMECKQRAMADNEARVEVSLRSGRFDDSDAHLIGLLDERP